MNCLSRIFSIFLIASLLSGCLAMQAKHLQKPVEMTPEPDRVILPSQLDIFMQYYEFLQEKTPSELAHEFDKVKKDFTRSNSDVDRIRYILLLSLPNANFRNISDALTLLITWPPSAQQFTSMGSFRKLLTQLLTEQQHLNSTLRNFSDRLKTTEQYSEELQRQVDDIKDMEKSLIRREAHPNIN